MYCSYYQAVVNKKETWFFVAVLRSFGHMCFDRTLDRERGLFEFYVPAGQEQRFVVILGWLQKQGIISDLTKLPNRLMDPAQEL